MDLKKKVVLFTPEFPPFRDSGGIGNHALNLAKQLTAQGHAVTVVTETRHLKENPYSNSGMRVVFVPRKSNIVFTIIGRLNKLLSVSKKNDLVICSGKFPLWTAPILRFRFSKKKYIAILHGTELDARNPVKKWYTNYCLTLFDKLVSVSGYTAQFIPKKLLDKVTIIPNGVDLEVDKTHQLIQDKILTVGSTSQRKGQLNVVHALPSLLKSYPNAHYYMIGLEGYKEKIASKAELLYIPDHCHLLGKLSDAEMYEQYRQTEVYMLLSEHTSDGDFEGFGISVLEANYFGVPAIGSKNSGIEDAIEDGKTGILVDPHQPEQILLAYKTIKENYNFFSENALNWAEKHHWCKIVNRYQEVIESLYSR